MAELRSYRSGSGMEPRVTPPGPRPPSLTVIVVPASADCDRVDRYRVHAVGHCKATTCEAAAGRLLSRGVDGATCHRGVNDHSLESIGERERLRLGIADRGEAVVPLR